MKHNKNTKSSFFKKFSKKKSTEKNKLKKQNNNTSTKKNTFSLVGILIKQHEKYLIKINQPYQLIPIDSKKIHHCKLGDRVVISKNNKNKYEIIGTTMEGDFFETSQNFIKKHILFKEEFSDKILKSIENLEEPQYKNYPQRKNLTSQKIITIDPHGARDHDDAISFSKSKSGWNLNIHIADVSEYILENSDLDKEALQRSFTRYLPWKVISMLPQKLSNQLCSLQENKQRLTLTCAIQLNSNGKVLSFSFFESIIQVEKFYTYEEAWTEYQNNDPYFKNLAILANLIKNQRQHIIEFDFPENKIILNETGEPERIQPIQRVPSYQWIEDFMLICNQCCAKWMQQHKIPGLYRVHENPDQEKFLSLATYPQIIENPKKWLQITQKINPTKKINQEYRQLYSEILVNINNDQQNIKYQILRTMKKAIYSGKNLGHFALGFQNYAHFTSPIRRYPDLWNHRFMKYFLRKEKTTKISLEHLNSKATLISEIEIATTKLERNSHKCSLAWILRKKVGDYFSATIIEVSEKGLVFFFQDNTVSGEEWIPIFCMSDDYYIFLERTQTLKGKRNHKTFKVGQKIKVLLETVIPAESIIRFGLS